MPDEPESTRIGPYRIERRLGQGGMGEVFLAWDDRLERRVAVKRIRHETGLPPRLRERFRREARAAARLNHPAIAQVHDLVEDGSGDAIVFEYVEGVTLAERLAGGALGAAAAVRLGREIAEGLAAAHQAGLIHRDLKAENVIVTPAGRAKILDFGLVRTEGEERGDEALTQHGAIVGTYHAMSPEQAGGGDVDARSDLFSLGALLYQMLTGRAPFRGASPLDTLRRVLTENPPPLPDTRPDVPPELDDLVGRLLAKDRDLRPRSAAEVALALARLETRLAATGSVSDQPTGAFPMAPPGIQNVERTAGRPRRWVAAVILLALAVVAGVLWVVARAPAPPLRVAVARPEVRPPEGDPGLALAASGVLTALLDGLAGLEGAVAIDPREASRGGGSPVAMARAAAADEVLFATVEREQGEIGRVSLRRIAGSDGRVLWSAAFTAPTDAAGLPLLAAEVSRHLRLAYPDHPPRAGAPRFDVRGEDFAAYLAVKQRLDAGSADLQPELARLEAILRGSPLFLDAQIRAASVSLALLRATRDGAWLDRAAGFAGRARGTAPDDPRPLVASFRVALAGDREREADALLARIARLRPGYPELPVLRSNLAEHAGRWTEAEAELRTAVARVPSWQNRYWLAQLAARRGRIDSSREQLAAVLAQAPENAWAREALGEIELIYGDLARAERVYADLARSSPKVSTLTNLGMARSFRGRFREAEEAYRQALELSPGFAVAMLNLADTEMDLGRRDVAEVLYRQALQRIEGDAPKLGLLPKDAMMRAQCLARLGRAREAAAAAREVLRRSPDDPQLLYEAALVFSLAGERAAALAKAREAVERGIKPRWLAISAFDPLRADPAFQRLRAGS
jgi:serine/threonine-protein kinase